MQACCNDALQFDGETTMERTPNTLIASLIAAAGLGALVMFLLDPQSGARRVALARDRARRLAHQAADAAGTGWRDLRHRASGVAAGARHLVHRDEVSDRVLEERVRAELGRWVSHPHAVSVSVREGRVLLGGAVLTPEQAPLKRAIERVRGVLQVDSQVLAYDSAGRMPMLQGGTLRAGRVPAWPRGKRHAPATQLLGASASVALLAGAALRRGMPGLLLAAAGAAIAAEVASERHSAHGAAGSQRAARREPPRRDDARRGVTNERQAGQRATARASA
jgi:hypothetical protein